MAAGTRHPNQHTGAARRHSLHRKVSDRLSHGSLEEWDAHKPHDRDAWLSAIGFEFHVGFQITLAFALYLVPAPMASDQLRWFGFMEGLAVVENLCPLVRELLCQGASPVRREGVRAR